MCAELEQRHGDLFYEDHGALQLDRTDPVELDHARAGFSIQDDGGFLFRPGEGAASAAAEVSEAIAQLAAITADRDVNHRQKLAIQARLEHSIGIGNRAHGLSAVDRETLADLNQFYRDLLDGKVG